MSRKQRVRVCGNLMQLERTAARLKGGDADQ